MDKSKKITKYNDSVWTEVAYVSHEDRSPTYFCGRLAEYIIKHSPCLLQCHLECRPISYHISLTILGFKRRRHKHPILWHVHIRDAQHSRLIAACMMKTIMFHCSVPDHWTQYDFPNPQVDYTECGRPYPSYVCTPQSWITDDEGEPWLVMYHQK